MKRSYPSSKFIRKPLSGMATGKKVTHKATKQAQKYLPVFFLKKNPKRPAMV
ncbi:hypothetical protein [Microbulbifer litoralis]|uniref:hypothetical protein n=1 Tax=Microbulbifer litoralis TaxID=2933965 RepID=UPI002029417D|nr:hypothetical protein [Microbulbifer sp. GX H0434]